MASFDNTSAITPYSGVSNNPILSSIKKNIINDPEYQKHVEGVETTYDLLNDKSQLAAGRIAVREAEDNKMAAVTTCNALNKSISTNKELKKENTYLRTEVCEYKTKYGELDAAGLKRLEQKKNELQIATSSSTSNIQEILQMLQESSI